MAKEIYNKNAREAHLMAEAYSQVNEGHAGPVHNWKQQAGLEKRYKLKSVGGQHGEQEHVVGEFDTIDEVIDFIDLPEEYGREWTVDIRDNREWSSEGFQDGLSHFGIGEIFDVVDTQSVVEDAEDSTFNVGQYVNGIDGMEIITNIDKQGEISTIVLTDEGNDYKPGSQEYEELEDWDEHVKYHRASTYRPHYGQY